MPIVVAGAVVVVVIANTPDLPVHELVVFLSLQFGGHHCPTMIRVVLLFRVCMYVCVVVVVVF